MDDPAPSPGDHAALGLLFVHGIGLHSRAATIVRFGTRLLNDLKGWLPAGYEAVVASASIESDRVGPDPAHAIIHIKGPNEFKTSWLIAESWWSGVFSKPRYRDVAAWGVKIAPVTIAYHMQRRFDRALDRFVMTVVRDGQRYRDRRWGGRIVSVLTRFGLSWWHLFQLGGELAVFLIGLFAIPLVVALIAVLVVVGFVPIPPLQRFIRSVQHALTGSIGDSFILLDSPLQGAAIVGRIRKDFEWLRLHSDRQVLIAHSQGAAVSHMMIRDLPADQRPSSFITFGSGIKKLNELRAMKKRSRWLPWLPTLSFLGIAWFAWHDLGPALRSPSDLVRLFFAAYFFGLAAVVLRMVVMRIGTRRRFVVLVVLYGVLALVVSLFARSESVRLENAVTLFVGIGLLFIAMGALRPQDLPAADLSLGLGRWIDLFASNDPVPNGSLGAAGLRGPDRTRLADRFDEYEVHNSGSMLRDHSTYWINSEQFVIPLIRSLGQAQDPPVSFGDDADRLLLSVASYRRRWRVRWLSWIRGSVIALALLAAWGDRNAMIGFGRPITNAVWSAIQWIPGIDDLIKSPTTQKIVIADKGFGLIAALVSGWIAVALGLSGGYLILLLFWKWWTAVDIRVVFGRQSFGRLPIALATLTLLTVAFAIGVVSLGFTSGLFDKPRLARFAPVGLTLATVIVGLVVTKHWVTWSRSGAAQRVLDVRAGSLRRQILIARDLAQATTAPLILNPIKLILNPLMLIFNPIKFFLNPSKAIVMGFLAKRIPRAEELLVLEGHELLSACELPYSGAFEELSAVLEEKPAWESRSEAQPTGSS